MELNEWLTPEDVEAMHGLDRQIRAIANQVEDAELDQFRDENGYIGAVRRPDGKLVALSIMLNGVDLIIGDRLGVDERFSFGNMATAAAALIVWIVDEFRGEPIGWVRHVPSYRRRVGGDPGREYQSEIALPEHMVFRGEGGTVQ